MKNERAYIFLFAFMLLGLLITVQFKSVLNSNKGKTSIQFEIENYKQLLNDYKVKESKLREEIDRNLKLKSEFERSFFERNSDKAFESEWEKVNLIAGLTNVVGNGVTIKLNDAPSYNNKPEEAKYYIFHDIEIVQIINELNKAGAQALSINNERIISTTDIICLGPTIRINESRYSVPFEIKAIGQPKKLYDSINNSEIIQQFRKYGKRIEIKEAKDIIIPKYSGNVSRLIKGLEVTEK